MKCSILNMLNHLDLSLLEVLFIYTITMSRKEIFSLSAHISSFQLVTGLPDSTKRAAKGHAVVSGPWAGSYEHSDHLFEPRHSLGILGRANYCPFVLSFITIGLSLTYITWCIARKRRRGQLVEWVDKTSFNRLNKLFMISTSERDHETLLTNQNLLSLVRDSQPYTVPSLPRLAPTVLVPNEHYVVKDFFFYEEAQAKDVKAMQD